MKAAAAPVRMRIAGPGQRRRRLDQALLALSLMAVLALTLGIFG